MNLFKKKIFSWIKSTDSDNGFEHEGDASEASDATSASYKRIRVLEKQVEMGLPLWHPQDRKTRLEANSLDD